MAIMMQEGGEGEGGGGGGRRERGRERGREERGRRERGREERGRGRGGGGGGGNTLEVIDIMQGMGSTIIQFLFKINWTNKSDLKESCCKRENF